MDRDAYPMDIVDSRMGNHPKDYQPGFRTRGEMLPNLHSENVHVYTHSVHGHTKASLAIINGDEQRMRRSCALADRDL
jgi:hypothetical protein